MPSPGILRRGQSPASPHQLSAAEVAAVITLDVAQTSTHVHMDLPFCNRPGEQHYSNTRHYSSPLLLQSDSNSQLGSARHVPDVVFFLTYVKCQSRIEVDSRTDFRVVNVILYLHR